MQKPLNHRGNPGGVSEPAASAVPLTVPDSWTEAWFDNQPHRTAIFLREQLHPGDTFSGPALVCEPTSTVVVDPGFEASIRGRGEIVIARRAATVVPSPPSSGERARVRGQGGVDAPDLQHASSSAPQHSPLNTQPSPSPPHPNSLPLKAGGEGTGTANASPTSLPAPHFSATPFQYDPVPQRDARFADSYNAGVNPEAFLYDERFAARDKVLMMLYKRLREIDVPEMMASILTQTKGKPWKYTRDMTRQLWDEARHAMLGEVGFVALGIDWSKIPINFTWSLNLNTQLEPWERHAVLFFIEQGLMPRTGKRYEWEVGQASGLPLAAVIQDFDWADEVLHAQIGREWYVKEFKDLHEAMGYGDRCWTKVLSHWRAYVEQGLTEHHNWWPEIYEAACQRWGVTPDPLALAYCTTYESIRADLADISMSG